jgi:hypothetical protein
MKCALPPWAIFSERDPVPMSTPRAMDRLPGTSSVTIRTPLGKTVLLRDWGISTGDSCPRALCTRGPSAVSGTGSAQG